HILGCIGVHDVMDVLAAEAREDAPHKVGTSPRELIRPARAWTIARVRLPWPAACLACSLASAFLLRAFEPVLDRAIMLVPFISIMTAVGGNVAVQSATLLLHAWIRPDDGPLNTLCFLRRELKAALILATVCGPACSFVAVTILGRGNVALALVVFPAMVVGVTGAPVAGVCVPTVLRRLGIDPAIASTPAVMALSDLMGIAFYLAIAMPFLGHLRS
ncbi:MAG: magnesium transporter, partial [Myxococcota bacterium]